MILDNALRNLKVKLNELGCEVLGTYKTSDYLTITFLREDAMYELVVIQSENLAPWEPHEEAILELDFTDELENTAQETGCTLVELNRL